MFQSRRSVAVVGLLAGSLGFLSNLRPLAAAEPAPAAPVGQRIYFIPVVAPMPTAAPTSNAGRTLVPVQNLVPQSIGDTQARPMTPILGTAPPATAVQPSVVPPSPAISSAVPAAVPQDILIQAPLGYVASPTPTIQYMPYGQTVLSDSINHPGVSSGGFGGGCSSCGESTYTGRFKLVHKLSSKFFSLVVCGPQYPCASDGCVSPLGCNNIHSATAFLFGSCSTFFGNQASAPLHCSKGQFPK